MTNYRKYLLKITMALLNLCKRSRKDKNIDQKTISFILIKETICWIVQVLIEIGLREEQSTKTTRKILRSGSMKKIT